MLASTPFSMSTYAENKKYREKNGEEVIYGTSVKIRSIYPPCITMYVVEMNNELNRIEGIGKIKNKVVYDYKRRIYENPVYNRYIYRGNKWLSREDIQSLDAELVSLFDIVLFKGKSHMKRKTGISALSPKIFEHWEMMKYYDVINRVCKLFA